MQISDDLIKHITRELMKRLGSRAAEKPLLHLVGSREDLSTPALARIQESFEIHEHREWEELLPSNASVLITELNIQALVRVTEGDEGCTVAGRTLLAALLNGQPVAALKDGMVWRRYQSTAPRGLLNRYSHYESVLQGYGLKLVSEDEVTTALLGRKSSSAPLAPAIMPAEPLPEPAATFVKPQTGRRVISEADLMKECPVAKGEGQSLRLGSGDLLTPLAQDYARAMKIDIIRS